MLNNLLEAAGCLLIIAFTWFVWPPLVLLAAGVLLVLAAVLRERRTTETKGGTTP